MPQTMQQETLDLGEKNPTWQQVSGILHLTPEEQSRLQVEEKKLGFQAVMTRLLQENKWNKQLALVGVKKDPIYFHTLSDQKLLQDEDIATATVRGLVEKGYDHVYVRGFIDLHFKKQPALHKKLALIYREVLTTATKVYIDDLNKGLELLKWQNPELYTILQKSWVLKAAGKGYRLDPKFQMVFSEALGKNDLYTRTDDSKKRQALKRQQLLQMLGISPSDLKEDAVFVIDILLGLLVVQESKQWEDTAQKKEPQKEMVADTDDELDIDEKLGFCVPDCQYTTSWGVYYVSTDTNKKVELSKEEVARFTSEGLRNFLAFYDMLYDLHLNFLWDKHKTRFVTMLNNVIGFQYPDGQGVTEARATRVLNLLGKSIGLIGNNSDARYTKWFADIGSAQEAFRNIKDYYEIDGQEYVSSGMYGASIVEEVLKSHGYIDPKSHDLVITRFLAGSLIAANDESFAYNTEEKEVA